LLFRTPEKTLNKKKWAIYYRNKLEWSVKSENMPRSRIVSLKATLGLKILQEKIQELKRKREARRRALKAKMEAMARKKKKKPA